MVRVGGIVMDGGGGGEWWRGSKGGRMSDGGMREWCGGVEEEQWNSPKLVGACVCLWVLATIHACSFLMVGSHCSFIDGRLRSWWSLWVVAVNGGLRHCLWALDICGWVVVICGHSIFMVGGHGHQWGGSSIGP